VIVQNLALLNPLDILEFTGVDLTGLGRKVKIWPVHQQLRQWDETLRCYLEGAVIDAIHIHETCMVLENHNPFILVLTPRRKGYIYHIEGWFDKHEQNL
jgi:hypothetical protein